MKAVVRRTVHGTSGEPLGDRIYVWCPGCALAKSDIERSTGSGLHGLPIRGTPGAGETSWNWNGDLELVTLDPSILTRYPYGDSELVCHSYVRNGQWQFLTDCSHALAGQTVDMVDLPDWVTRDV